MPFLVCGLDEVGRGALAGPLMAVATLCYTGDGTTYEIPSSQTFCKSTCPHNQHGICPHGAHRLWGLGNSPVPGVNDSKKLSPKKRRELFHQLLRNPHVISFGLGEVSVEEINAKGIEWANDEAFQRAIRGLPQAPHYLLVDGDNPVYGWSRADQRVQPQADGTWWPVAAASILAKVIRDSYMKELAEDYPIYQWDKNSGYGTEKHCRAITEQGPCDLHRRHFIRNLL